MDARSADGCPHCGGSTLVRPVPAGLRGLLAEDPAMVRLCRSCLAVIPAPGEPAHRDWEPTTVSEALPPDPEAALGVALLLEFLSSLAFHRTAIEAVVGYLADEKGVDPLLTLQRIRRNASLTPPIDLERRERQLTQLLEDQR